MAVIKKMFKKFLGFDEEFDEEQFFSEEESDNDNSYYKKNSIQTNSDHEIQRGNNIKNIYQQHEHIFNEHHSKEIVLFPKSFADACDVVENLEQGHVVVLNMEDIDIDTCKRISDFVLGAIYVLQGDVEKISKKSFRFWINKY